MPSTLRFRRWAIASALGGGASVVHAGPWQEEHGHAAIAAIVRATGHRTPGTVQEGPV